MPAQTVRRCVLGNPENRRLALYQAALARRALPPAEIIAYRDLLQSWDFGFLQRTDLLRIDSPGEDFHVERELIALGAPSDHRRSEDSLGGHGFISAEAARQLEFERGRLRHTRQWYAGYRHLLNRLASHAPPSMRFYNRPEDIVLMFDKPRCQTRLQTLGVRTPPRLEGVNDFASLREAAMANRWSRVFVKIAHGSSAAGVAAVHFHADGVRAISTVESVAQDDAWSYYNNLQTQTYQRKSDVERLINALFREGAHAEKWLQKASFNGRQFDLRVVVIAGRAEHVVVRTSHSPMTNLHLGNQRGDLQSLRAKMGEAAWRGIMEVAVHAATVVPESLYVGVDIMVAPGFRHPCVLEVNAFGDLLPGVEHDGRDTYESEIAAEARLAAGPATSDSDSSG